MAAEAEVRYRAELPWLGPMLVRHRDPVPYVSLGASPLLGEPDLVCMLPLERGASRWQILRAPIAGKERAQILFKGGRTDWFTESLPSWVGAQQVRYLAVLLLYRQGRALGEPVHDSGHAPDSEALRQALTGGAPSAGTKWFGGGATEPDERPITDAQRKAIEEAIAALGGDEASPPPGLLEFDWTEGREGLRLALGSCQYPPGIVNQVPGYESWQRLARCAAPPEVLVLTGDQIYADATAGLFDPGQRDDRYRKPYETWLRNGHVRDVLRRVPVVATLDDHEIDDNWEPISPSCPAEVVKRNTDLRSAGVKAFLNYLRPPNPGGQQPAVTDPLWFAFTKNGIPVFVLDSRSEREPRAANATANGMLGRRQWLAFEAWLRADHGNVPRLVVSASALLPRHRRAVPPLLEDDKSEAAGATSALRSDGWDGYPQTFHALLGLIAEAKLRRLVFLSGDEHLGLHAQATLDGGSGEPVVVHSIHSPGLNTPYRFANATRADLVLDESFSFAGARGTHTCTVATRVFEGAGFVTVTLARQQGRWELRCEFPGSDALRIVLD